MKFLKYAIPLILAPLGFLIYSNVLHAPFIFDDEQYIARNYQIRDISNFIKDFLGTRYIGFLSFALNYYFGGLNTFGYHLVNIVIHILNAILVYILVSLTFKTGIGKGIGKDKDISLPIPLPAFIAFAVSLIFLVHPIQTQAVSYITQRFTSLATFFYLLALVLYVKARLKGEKEFYLFTSLPFYLLSLISAILAMKTKEISFTLPFIIALYEFIFFSNGSRIQSWFLYLIPYFLTLFIIPLTLFLPTSNTGFGETVRQLQILELVNLSKYKYLLTQFSVIVTYIRLLIFPIRQNLLYDYPLSNSIFEPATLLSFVFLLFTFISAIYLFIRSRKADKGYGLLISFGIMWFFITLSVESSIIPIKDVIYEHRIYLPSIGFILSITTAVFYGFNYLEVRFEKYLTYYLFSTILIITIFFSFLTYKRNILWGDNLLMWLDVVKKSPNNANAHYNLGQIFYEEDRLDDALKEYLISIRLNPEYADVHNNIGLVYYNKGLLDEAIKEFNIAIKLSPDYAPAHYNLGNIYANQDRLGEAIKEYKTTLRLNPYYADAYNNLGALYYEQGWLNEAKKEFETALKLKPDLTVAKEALEELNNRYR